MRKVTDPSDVGLTKVFERMCLYGRIRLILVGSIFMKGHATMGFFSRLMGGSDEQKTATSEFEILAPVSGELVHLEKTNDPAFSSRAVGDGVAVVPQEGTVCAPVSGTVAALFPTEHALGIMSDDSPAQVMLHIGIDTVKLEGKGFHALVAQGDHVDAGQPSSRSISTRSAPPASIPRSSLSCASVRRTRLFVSMLPALLLLKSLSSGFPSKFLWWVTVGYQASF